MGTSSEPLLGGSDAGASLKLTPSQLRLACLCTFFVAILNNNGFCIVVAASQDLANNTYGGRN